MKALSRLHSVVFRATRGYLGRRLVNNDMLLLTTLGELSGKKHTVPLLYLRADDRFIVIASYGGRPTDPQWYRNLVAHPTASVQIENTRHAVTATAMSKDERSLWWPRIVEAYADYAVYQSRTDRTIPVVWLEQVSDDSQQTTDNSR
ncbi:MAG: nitroreductase family deazaflavin-dependent oxidoreductase [Actinomycetia bacterium]|nr:nitroreductase family deazaflavin-dependent oxidoreductase [Actinomycetes bacterium]